MLSRWIVARGRACGSNSTRVTFVSSHGCASTTTSKRMSTVTTESSSSSVDKFWNNPEIQGLDRSKKTIKGDGTYFGYKLEPDTVVLAQRPSPRSVPIRHSAHVFPGPMCPPSLLEKASADILQADLGSLYSSTLYSDQEKEDEHVHILQQKIEALLRGYSACLEGSYLNLLLQPNLLNQHLDLNPLKQAAASSQFVPQTNGAAVHKHVETMRHILSRLEQEAEMYWNDKNSKITATEEDETSMENEFTTTVAANGKDTAPGPTTAMYDLVLDANAIYALCIPMDDHDAKIQAMNVARGLLQTVLQRHEASGGPANINPSTIPSPRTFNSVIQTATSIPYENTSSRIPNPSVRSDMVRDEAIDLAFTTLDKMQRNDAVNRTWTTYDWLLKFVYKFLPTSRSKGNVAYALFVHACDEGVVNESVWTTLQSYAGAGNGPDFERYLRENADKSWKQLPHKWRKHALTPNYGSKLRRSYNDGSLYFG